MVIKVKYNGEWVKIPYLSVNEDSDVNYVEEAPKDGNQYTRKDGVWTVLNIPDDITETINNKVDKVDGKDLSTNDYTNTDKTKVDNLTSVLVDADIAQTEFAATITLDKIDLSTGTTSDVEIELPASTTVLSGLMTAADKTKLNSIAVGAEVNVNADWNSTGGDSQILNKPDLTKYNNLPTWVFDASNLTTEEGENYITVHGNKKNLQTGETSEIGSTIYTVTSEHIGYMSPADKTILDGLAANAITSTEVDQKINSAIASVYKIKGTVANYEALPTTDVTIGDVYNLEDTGANYVATSTTPTWDKLSETVDLSAYSTTVQNDSKYQPKGNYLTSVPSEYVTDTELNNKNYATKTEIPTKVSQLTNDSKYLTTTPVATNSTIGGIMLGYSENNKNYAVKISSNKAYVTVPWVNTTYSNATTSAAGLMSSTDKSKLDGLNNYTLTQATSSALGGIKIGYTENGKNYPVELSNGKAFVNVPWTDTNTTYSNATTSTAGLLSAADKTKLNSIPSDVVEEAPLDDKQYVRQNGEWVNFTSFGYLDLTAYSGDDGVLSDDDYQKVVEAAKNEVVFIKKGFTLFNVSAIVYCTSVKKTSSNYKFEGISRTNQLVYDYSIVTITVEIATRNYSVNVLEFNFTRSGNGDRVLADNGQYIDITSMFKQEDGGSGNITKYIDPNIYYKFGECKQLYIYLNPGDSNTRNEYMFEFVSGNTATSFGFLINEGDTIKYAGGSMPDIKSNKTYQVSVINNLVTIQEF